MKETHKTVSSLGLTSGAYIKIVIGEPKAEGIYKLKIKSVQLTDAGIGSDQKFYSDEDFTSMDVRPDTTGAAFKELVASEYNKKKGTTVTVDDFALRNP